MNEINEAIHSAQTQANYLFSGNPRIIEEYQERKKEIDELTATLQVQQEDYVDQERQISQQFDTWKSTVRVSSSISFTNVFVTKTIHLFLVDRIWW